MAIFSMISNTCPGIPSAYISIKVSEKLKILILKNPNHKLVLVLVAFVSCGEFILNFLFLDQICESPKNHWMNWVVDNGGVVSKTKMDVLKLLSGSLFIWLVIDCLLPNGILLLHRSRASS